MSTKISELPSAASLTNADEVPIVQTGTTKKATVEQILSKGEDLSTAITYTAGSGVTITRFQAYNKNNVLFMAIDFAFSSGKSDRVIELLTFTNMSNLFFNSPSGYGRTYGSPAGSTVSACSATISNSTYKLNIYQTSGTALGGTVFYVLPMPTIS